MEDNRDTRPSRADGLAIDGVLSTQPELGPSVPDGGYGWVVFLATLFFQILIPSMAVSFGMFLAFSRLPNLSKEDSNPKLWDDRLLYAPLLFIATWTFVDPASRTLISSSRWPRLVSVAGTCLTCAGLLFLWMGMAGYGESSLYTLAGLMSGGGASILVSQCEILLAQYFKMKHSILAYITQAATALGFIAAPIVIGHHILNSSVLNVILWYQAIILQGLVCSLVFKKPAYLKAKYSANRYNYVSANPDDEEDIFSKNSRELQIKRQDNGTTVTIERHEIPSTSNETTNTSEATPNTSKNWVKFEDEPKEENTSPKSEWETFEDTEEGKRKENNWEKFDDPDEDKDKTDVFRISNGHTPMPLFSDSPVNNNNTYSYEVLEPPELAPEPAVFMPVAERSQRLISFKMLKQPTFYKSLLTVTTTRYSHFIFYTLFPSYLYQELDGLRIHGVAALMGVLSLSTLLFSGVAYWMNIEKARRPICLWFLCWVGCFGYFMVSDSSNKQVLTFGAVQVILSIATLQYVGMPLLGLTIRGETNQEYSLICTLTGCAFLLFLFINPTFRVLFRLMAVLHFFTGTLWFSNYIYKRIIK
ncbi:unnamed protein product [Callosobruchus maculatus]|uniref:Major facilitator superfamily (MFS) profile domain-containing protein n=2 Tax=Callosobruchus maculatus TaxID=64391 RepID=A0A653DDI3_CALMS|nr:unnamed protein product [Callosobruchus maculatus]